MEEETYDSDIGPVGESFFSLDNLVAQPARDEPPRDPVKRAEREHAKADKAVPARKSQRSAGPRAQEGLLGNGAYR